MQTETLYGSRGKAAVSAVLPTVVALILFGKMIGDGSLGSFGFLILLGVAIFGFGRAGDLIKPRQLVLDREGFVFHPSFGSAAEKIRWKDVKSFEIKGSNKNSYLACFYLAEDQAEVKKMKLGQGWSLSADSLWGASLEQVRGHLADYHRNMVGQGIPVRTASPSAVPSQTSRPSVPATISQPDRPVAAATRSGVVYAEPVRASTKAPMPVLNGDTGSSKGLGWALLVGGVAAVVLSIVPFMSVCKKGLCSAGLWELGDYRIWGFAILWTVCLLAVLVGGKLISSAQDAHSLQR